MQVRFSLAALAQLAEIFEYVARDRSAAAGRVTARIRAAADTLQQHPLLGRKIPRSKVRRLVVRGLPYILYYEVFGSEIVITRVRHGARRRAAFHEPVSDFRL